MKNKKLLIFFLLLSTSVYSQVSQQWTARENYGSSDWAYSVASDYAGNVYITGTRSISTYIGDIVTVKYSPTGVKLWEAVYNDTANQDDRGSDIAVDSAGNVYVIGSAMLSGSSPAYGMVLIKYNTGGVQQWIYHNYVNSSYIFGTVVELDRYGNVYAGEKYGTFVSGNGALVKFNSAGVFQWRANTARVYAIATDTGGNPVSSGTLGFQYVTTKYNTAGVQQWSVTTPGPCAGCDGPDAIAVDAAGNVYQTGPVSNTIVTYKYNNSGVQQWMRTYSAGVQNYSSSIGLDSSGNVYVGGSSTVSPDAGGYLIIKYNNSGVQQWTASYNRSGNFYDRLVAMVVDKAGNSYATGYSQTATDIGSADYTTVKYNSSGVQQWALLYNGPADSTDIPTAISMNSLGIYVTGYSVGPGNTYDFLTIKYSEVITGTSNPSSNIPAEFRLEQNYPNPFNPVTKIKFSLPSRGGAMEVSLKVYDLLGKEVANLITPPGGGQEGLSPGTYEVEWDASDFASGIYYYRLTVGSFSDIKKMVLIK